MEKRLQTIIFLLAIVNFCACSGESQPLKNYTSSAVGTRPEYALSVEVRALLSATYSSINHNRLKIKDYFKPPYTSGNVNELIKKIGPDGGVVDLNGSTIFVTDSIFLKSNTALINGRLLLSTPRTTGLINGTATQGEKCVSGVDGEGWQPGDAISIRDLDHRGWNGTRTTISLLDPLNNSLCIFDELKFSYRRRAIVSAEKPVLVAVGESNVVLKDLEIDGVAPQSWMYDFTNAAVHLVSVKEFHISGLKIKNWGSDGLSIQSGYRVSVEYSRFSSNLGHGVHLGTGFKSGYFYGNQSEFNIGDGLYFCSEVSGVLVDNNILSYNYGYGVGGLGDFGNVKNEITRNVVDENSLAAFYSGVESSNVIVGNVARGNATGKKSAFDMSGYCSVDDFGSVLCSQF